ncbi:hypothetical protein ILUMI_17870, partial [Ignelater luminosus]
MVVSMERWKGKVAVVTGASAGIGAAIAEALVNAGLQVIGIARSKERVQALAKTLENKPGKLYAVQADIRAVSILVNNAGIVRGTNLTDGNTKMWKEVLDTNVLGLCVATRQAVKSMRDNNIDGHIIHINSIAGHKVPTFPGVNVYAASKYAVTALTETLRQELNFVKSKIKITSISPGGTKTDIIQAADIVLTKELEDFLKSNPTILKPEDIADAVLYVLATPPHVQ